MVRSLQDVELYVILSPRSDMDYLEMAEQAILGGADMVQLRVKDWTDRKLIKIGEKLREITSSRKVLMTVNDRLDIALALGADGVHLGQQDMPLTLAKKLLMGEKTGTSSYERGKKGKLEKRSSFPEGHSVTCFIGLSTHSLEEAVKAEKDGADYISIGPIFPTPSKPELRPIGLNSVRQVRERVSIPFFAIGGIDQGNVEEVIYAGAERVAVIRAVCSAKKVKEATEDLRRKIRQAKG